MILADEGMDKQTNGHTGLREFDIVSLLLDFSDLQSGTMFDGAARIHSTL